MSEPKPASSGTGGNAGDPYRVMVVDDSAVIRGLLTRALEQDPTIKVAASVGNGEAALKALDRHDIDVIILDIEMPVMDGQIGRASCRGRVSVRLALGGRQTIQKQNNNDKQ